MSFNRRFPLQPFSPANLAGAGVIPGIGRTFTFSVTASVIFVATAAVSSTRTASVTASVIFVATNTFTQLFTSTVGVPSAPESVGGNAMSLSQGMFRPGLW